MRLTFLDAKKIVAQYAGNGGLCEDSPEVESFTLEVLEYMLMSGSYGSLKGFTFTAHAGEFTIPYELETPIKVKVNNVVGNVYDKWFEFHSSLQLGDDCKLATEALRENVNRYPTIYDGPSTGFYVGVQGVTDEAPDAHVIIQGKDPTGREIYTTHNGQDVVGEYLSIRKNQLVTSNVIFGTITGVIKTPTNGYTQLYSLCPNTRQRNFLADYSPVEEHPYYRRFKLTIPCGNVAKVDILGNIRLKAKYSDLEFIPFDNRNNIRLAGQALHARINQDLNQANVLDQTFMNMLGRENSYKNINNGKPINVDRVTSPGRIKNSISMRRRLFGVR